jgi:hypothetical protein
MKIRTIYPPEINTPELDKIKLPKWLKKFTYTTLQQKEIQNLIDGNVWITAGKIKLCVREMSSNHIQNCIKCWNGLGKMTIPSHYLGGKVKWLVIFKKELLNRQ